MRYLGSANYNREIVFFFFPLLCGSGLSLLDFKMVQRGIYKGEGNGDGDATQLQRRMAGGNQGRQSQV